MRYACTDHEEETMKQAKLFIRAILLSSLAAVCHAQNDGGPRLNLQVRKVECASDFTSWRFQIHNYGSAPVSLSDLQVRLWVYGGANPVEAQSWVSGTILDGLNTFAVSGVTLVSQPMN